MRVRVCRQLPSARTKSGPHDMNTPTPTHPHAHTPTHAHVGPVPPRIRVLGSLPCFALQPSTRRVHGSHASLSVAGHQDPPLTRRPQITPLNLNIASLAVTPLRCCLVASPRLASTSHCHSFVSRKNEQDAQPQPRNLGLARASRCAP